jgi:hypothetical protein
MPVFKITKKIIETHNYYVEAWIKDDIDAEEICDLFDGDEVHYDKTTPTIELYSFTENELEGDWK